MCDVVGKSLARLIMRAIKPPPVRRDPVEALPEEVLHLIWRLLELKDLLSASLVSRQWHASLSSDNVWKRYTDKKKVSSDKTKRSDKVCSWKTKFLSQRSLLHNWSKNRYHSCIRTPVIGTVVGTARELCIWRDSSVVVMCPTNAVITNHIKLTDRIESVQACSDSDLLLVTTESRSAQIFRSSDDQTHPLLTIELDQFEKQCKLTSNYLCRCTHNKIILYDLSQDPIKNMDIRLPDCKQVNSYYLLKSCILLRTEPLDFNYECVYLLYDLESSKWSIIRKICSSQLGNREYIVQTHKDYYLILNYNIVDDVFMYSNVYIYNKDKQISQQIISNCRRDYFRVDFARNICLFTVADYRLLAIDMSNLKNREIYVTGGFKSLNNVLDRYFILTYTDKMEVWDLKYWKRLYSIKINDKDRLVIRDEFIGITSWPGTSLPPSLRILNFTQPELTESPSSSTFDLSNIFI